jgi:hypothetical protein
MNEEYYKKCNVCEKSLHFTTNNFPIEKRNKAGLSGTCINCTAIIRKNRDEKIKNTIKPKLSYLTCSVCKIKKPANTDYFHKHSRSLTGYKNSCKECRKIETHKYHISSHYKQKMKNKRLTDLSWKLRKNISTAICNGLKKQKSKKEFSCFFYLGYSINELKIHLESQFEPWMNWDNWGQISSEKRTWNIDHIYPQSKLPYDNMEHPNFKKCWSLNNLRPICSYENVIKKDKIL